MQVNKDNYTDKNNLTKILEIHFANPENVELEEYMFSDSATF